MREAAPVEHISEDSPRKFKAYERAVGEPLFVGGMEMEGMLHGALHFSEHPRARILKIDTSRAEALPGVVRVFTARDVPGQRTIGMIIKDWDVYIAEGEVTRYIGDVLAMVVAETHLIARGSGGPDRRPVRGPRAGDRPLRGPQGRDQGARGRKPAQGKQDPLRRGYRQGAGRFRARGQRHLPDPDDRARLPGAGELRGLLRGRPADGLLPGDRASTKTGTRLPTCWACSPRT